MGTNMVRNVTILAFFTLVIITSLISVFLAWSVTKPIKKLGRIMQEVEEGNLSVSIPVHSKDEVGVLAQSFDSMLTEIRNLIQKNYSIEIRQKNAELYALQSQINLYNDRIGQLQSQLQDFQLRQASERNDQRIAEIQQELLKLLELG